MAGLLEGKVAVITGAASGIGRASAVLFAREGAKVVIADVQDDKLAETLKLVKDAGGEAVAMRCDVAKAADTEALVAKAVSTYGRLDCAYNNAGVAGAMNDRIGDSDEKNFDFTIDINLKGVFLCMKAQINQFLKQGGGGAIVNTASLAGLVGVRRGAAYGASKHGVIAYTKGAALEYATKGIRVNAVCPGGIETPMLEEIMGKSERAMKAMIDMEPVHRLGKPEEIAEAACWLLCDRASFVTGVAMPVDGGAYAQ
jgi:NAD(P)-dependent dehydrogenase (short-subunit alcohol dehydrogenase family)